MRTWEDHAECFGWPEDLFQTTQRGNPHPGVISSLCDQCPVRLPCLADGWWDEWSIRGGMTPGMRVALTELVVVASSGLVAAG